MLVSILVSVLSGVLGVILTLIYTESIRKRNVKEHDMHHAVIMHNELKSIENDLLNERGSVNIRYSAEWEHNVAECSFLSPDDVDLIYEIYNLVYSYNYHYMLKEKNGAVTKEDINEYCQLKKKFEQEAIKTLLKTLLQEKQLKK